ncbi:MAG: Clp protease ClpP [Flavobacteriales bacterium]|nr:Clp protease ClpP [Flavobacteriales bacterium]
MRSLNIRCSQSEQGVELAILGEITSWTAEDIIRSVNYFKGQPITLMLMSAGGDALASLGLHDFLGQHDVTVEIYGVAASGAAIVSASGKRVRIAENGFVMIHEAFTYDEQYNRVQTDTTKMIDDRQVEVFASRTGKKRDKVRAWLAAETFFTAEEAVANGFADEVIPAMKMAASLKTMVPMSEVIKETPVEVETVTEEVKAEEEQAETTEATEQTEVEVEIPITPIEAVKAGLHGSFKAKVKVDVSANYAGIIASMAEELKGYKAQLDEANAQVETLTEKAAEVDAAKQAEAEAKAAAEAAQAEVQKLKETPVEEAIVSNADGTVVKPGAADVADGPTLSPSEIKTKEDTRSAGPQVVRRQTELTKPIDNGSSIFRIVSVVRRDQAELLPRFDRIERCTPVPPQVRQRVHQRKGRHAEIAQDDHKHHHRRWGRLFHGHRRQQRHDHFPDQHHAEEGLGS